MKSPHYSKLLKTTHALLFSFAVAVSAQAAPDEQSADEQMKLINSLTEQFPAIKQIVDLYKSSFVNAKPFFDEVGVELPEALVGKQTHKSPDAQTAPAAQSAPTAQAAPAQTAAPAAYQSPLGDSHVQGSGHLDGYTPLPSGTVVSSPTREDLARRAEYERANIEAYYFFKAMRERRQ